MMSTAVLGANSRASVSGRSIATSGCSSQRVCFASAWTLRACVLTRTRRRTITSPASDAVASTTSLPIEMPASRRRSGLWGPGLWAPDRVSWPLPRLSPAQA